MEGGKKKKMTFLFTTLKELKLVMEEAIARLVSSANRVSAA